MRLGWVWPPCKKTLSLTLHNSHHCTPNLLVLSLASDEALLLWANNIYIIYIVFDFFFMLAGAPLLLMKRLFHGVNNVFLYYKIVNPRYEKNELFNLTTVTSLDAATYYSLFFIMD
jgi:hypothetical protein